MGTSQPFLAPIRAPIRVRVPAPDQGLFFGAHSGYDLWAHLGASSHTDLDTKLGTYSGACSEAILGANSGANLVAVSGTKSVLHDKDPRVLSDNIAEKVRRNPYITAFQLHPSPGDCGCLFQSTHAQGPFPYPHP